MKKLAFAAAALLATTAAPAVAAPIVYNLTGTFTGTIGGNPFTTTATFTGTGDNSAATTAFGNPAVTAVALTSLTATTAAGDVFVISTPALFYTYGPGQYGNANSRLGITFNGDGNNYLGLESAAFNGYDGLSSFSTTPGTSYTVNAQFVANGAPVVITNLADGSFGATAAVPEPATWGMMLLGFGMVGFGMRRRKASVRTSVRFA